MPRSWSPSLLDIERISAIDSISSATRPRPGASCTSLTAVSMAPVPAAIARVRMRVEGLELARPALHPEHDDQELARGFNAASAASRWPTGVSQRGPGKAGAAEEVAAVEVRHIAIGQWFHENSVELIKRPDRGLPDAVRDCSALVAQLRFEVGFLVRASAGAIRTAR